MISRVRAAIACARQGLAVFQAERDVAFHRLPGKQRARVLLEHVDHVRRRACRPCGHREAPRPRSASTSPAMICNKVDLPQPDGPTMETKLPRSISRSTPLSATVVPPGAAKDLCTPLTRRNAGTARHRRRLRAASARASKDRSAASASRTSASAPWCGSFPRRSPRCRTRQQHLVLERRIETGELRR